MWFFSVDRWYGSYGQLLNCSPIKFKEIVKLLHRNEISFPFHGDGTHCIEILIPPTAINHIPRLLGFLNNWFEFHETFNIHDATCPRVVSSEIAVFPDTKFCFFEFCHSTMKTFLSLGVIKFVSPVSVTLKFGMRLLYSFSMLFTWIFIWSIQF